MSVIAGVDDSPVSKLVLARAAEQAIWRGTDLHAVHVASSPTFYSEAPIDWATVIDAQRESVWSALESTLSALDVRVTRVDLEGYPPDALVAYTTDMAAPLLVVGTRGRGEFASLILGSTSQRSIHLATCDVLIVKPDEEPG